MDESPFIVKERRLVCQNSVFKINFDHLTDGKISLVEDYLVVEPKVKNINDITGVAILPIKDEKIGLVRVYRHAVSEYGWEVPRGFIDENETDKEAAVRELKEETGILCDISMLKSLGTICPEPGVISAKVNMYMAIITNIGRLESEEELGHIDFEWFTYDEVEKLILKNKMIDATSQILFLRTK